MGVTDRPPLHRRNPPGPAGAELSAGASLLELADRSLADTGLHLASHATHGRWEERGGLVLFAGAHNHPGPYSNGLLRLDRRRDAASVLEQGGRFFAPLHRAFVVWARVGVDDDLEALCRARGWFERPPEEGMPIIVRQERFPAAPEDAPLPVLLGTRAQAESYLGVVADAYGVAEVPPAIQAGLFFPPAAAVAEGALSVTLELEGRPASGTMVVTSRGVGCSLWTATAPFARGRGLGPECVRAACNLAFERGARLVVAQSSQMGLPTWIKLGFEVVGHYRRFVSPSARRP